MISISSTPFNSLTTQLYAGRCPCSSDDEWDGYPNEDFYGGWSRGSSKNSTIKNMIYDLVEAQLTKKKVPKGLRRSYRARMKKLKNPSLRMLMSAFKIPKRALRKMGKSGRSHMWSLFKGIRYPQSTYFKKKKKRSSYSGPTYEADGIIFPGRPPKLPTISGIRKKKKSKKKKRHVPKVSWYNVDEDGIIYP